MTQEKKLTQTEIDELTSIQNKYLEITAKLGQLHLEKISSELNLKRINKEISEIADVEFINMQADELKIQDSLVKKYGTGTINLESGVFISEV